MYRKSISPTPVPDCSSNYEQPLPRPFDSKRRPSILAGNESNDIFLRRASIILNETQPRRESISRRGSIFKNND